MTHRTTLTCSQSPFFHGSYGLVQPVQPYDYSIITCHPQGLFQSGVGMPSAFSCLAMASHRHISIGTHSIKDELQVALWLKLMGVLKGMPQRSH
jgi:hypothetical protein